jgi:hypothetical protein
VRLAQATNVATSESTTSLTYTDLATPGPAVTVTVPASGKALEILTSALHGSTGGATAFMGVAVSGATAVAATDAQALEVAGNNEVRASATVLLTGLNPGSNTFTAKYKELVLVRQRLRTERSS